MKTNESAKHCSLCSSSQGPAACWEAAQRGMGWLWLQLWLCLMEMYEMPPGLGLATLVEAGEEVWRAFWDSEYI